jgi:hypothetical protein
MRTSNLASQYPEAKSKKSVMQCDTTLNDFCLELLFHSYSYKGERPLSGSIPPQDNELVYNHHLSVPLIL